LTKFFPNPAQNQLFLETQQPITDIFLTDLSGKNIEVNVEKSNGRYVIDLSEIESGIYIVNYQNQNIQKQQKIIKF